MPPKIIEIDEEYKINISRNLESINERTYGFIKAYCLEEQSHSGKYEPFILPSQDFGTSTTACVVRIKYGRLIHLQSMEFFFKDYFYPNSV